MTNILVAAAVSVVTTLLINLVSEAAKRGASAKVVAHQLHAQIDILQDDIGQFSGLKGAKEFAEEWLKARNGSPSSGQPKGAHGDRVRLINRLYRNRLDALVLNRESLETMWARLLHDRRNPVLLDAAIRSFSESDEMLANNQSLISNSDAATLGPEIASGIIEFRQKQRDAYKLMRFIEVYLRDTREPKLEDVSPYLALYFRNLIESFVALSELESIVAKRRDMGMMEHWLREFG